jgi:lysophospholipase L1-like esterase
MMHAISRLATAVLLAAFVAVPVFAARGSADFTRFVTLGDSFGAGVSSVGLNIRHQQYSWPAMIARQVGLDVHCVNDGPRCFQIPYISEPGILPELELVSLSPLSLQLKPGLGTPLRLALPRPYNNLSIDGAEVSDLIRPVSGDGNEAINAAIVHRNLGVIVDQALALNPTFIAIWIGGNDGFNGVQRGRPEEMTSVADFTSDYNALLARLTAGAPNAGMVVGTLPTDIRIIPYANVVPPVFVNPATRQPVLVDGQMIPLIGDLGGGNIGPLPPGSLLTLPAAQLIASGYGIPPALVFLGIVPPLPDIGKPLPDSVVLTPPEIAAIQQRLTDFNGVIRAAAAARDIPVADIDAFLRRAAAGIHLGPVHLDLSYITGGLISYDGFHLTDIGYMFFANEYIRTINAAYGTKIPLASLAMFYQDADPAHEQRLQTIRSLGFGMPEFTPDAAAALRGDYVLTPAPSTPSRRLRSLGRGGK